MPPIHLGGISLSKLLKHVTRAQEGPQALPSLHVPGQAPDAPQIPAEAPQIPAESPLINTPEQASMVASATKTEPTNEAPSGQKPAKDSKVKTTPPQQQPPLPPPIPLIRIIAQPNHVSIKAGNILNDAKAQSATSHTSAPNDVETGASVRPEQGGVITELNNIMDNGIPNAGETLQQLDLDNTVKETQLLQVIKDAIPVKSRRPSDIDNDIKEELDDLKDYASALSGIADLSPTQHDNLAKKLARDLLDDLRVSESKKEELLQQLMRFVTDMELATFRERIAEIRAQVLSFASQESYDTTKIRNEATRLLNELIEKLPLSKDQRDEKEKRLLESKLLSKLVEEGAKRALRNKLRKALADLVADKLL